MAGSQQPRTQNIGKFGRGRPRCALECTGMFLECSEKKPGFPGKHPPTGLTLPPLHGQFPVTPSPLTRNSPGASQSRSPTGQLRFPWPLPAGQAFLWLPSKVSDQLLEK